MKKIERLLIANRGEIAVRIIRTCKKLGIHSICIYSEADSDSVFVKLADESHLVGPAQASESYLHIPKIIDICKKSKADAVHPGYGFLSESPAFAKALEEAGILFIGPSVESVRLMGDKIQSRIAMIQAGIPVVPGYDGKDQDGKLLLAHAKEIGFPVMVKASAGGGGKGMRRVDREEDFMESLLSAKREAKNFFGDDTIFIEKFISNPRHIEFQVFGDKHGNAIHVFERDCSVQRRHQKIIEESPAFNLDNELRNKMGEVAVCVAKSISYIGAGTVEFIVSDKNEFYFMEMNTRLQVEHPVTEMVTDLDLVELQIKIAEGDKLSVLPKLLEKHSIEVRIYAEDPENNFLPSTGKILFLKNPSGDGVRLDSGIELGSEVTIYYDPMIAKLIVTAPNRSICIENLISALDQFIIFGITTNISYLKKILSHSEFKAGNLSTGFIDKYLKNDILIDNSLVDTIGYAHLLSNSKVQSQFVNDNFRNFQFWAKNAISNKLQTILFPDILNSISKWKYRGELFEVKVLSFSETDSNFKFRISILNLDTKHYTERDLETAKEKFGNSIQTNLGEIIFYQYGLTAFIHLNGTAYQLRREQRSVLASQNQSNTFTSPMPGKVIQIFVKEKDFVKAGDTLAIVEAMKMENAIKSHKDCEVVEVSCNIGDLVRQDDILIRVK
ncbi:MAG TPA: acetyl-CoA carboxylase biotin carboxylase subunit [Leptospiraceae bacterium]|nr:acetyl-CoA carboxylase biotin carboxylase subunit [Leptospiraceae bacterium]HMX30871.1 acetyl-CoA carboxylase biotin carboxylase subunit [Leptospiraceae bacterium]HMY33994.1 acetyl-CoA carboxylase biotin carboxylase subunit [Leptospiraceae bacterium]HMZ66520.1 acetyl-CoA carboxylase biotin carboxylase subunit [Leptospiraceae bacterium]HNA09412.1 acetyl-CoA carboxylase biotin carboxylase subunit [Leptospiraceae bacterium]